MPCLLAPSLKYMYIDIEDQNRGFAYKPLLFCIQNTSFKNLLALPQAKDVNVKKLNILETKKMKIFDLFDDKRVNF